MSIRAPCETFRAVEHELVPFWREQWGIQGDGGELLTGKKGMNGEECQSHEEEDRAVQRKEKKKRGGRANERVEV